MKGLLIPDLSHKFCTGWYTGAVRQGANGYFIKLLNKVKKGEFDEYVNIILDSRFIALLKMLIFNI